MASLQVGTGKQYQTIAAAGAAARDGDTIAVSAGVYADDFVTVRSRVTLQAVGGQVTLLATRPLASGAALLTVSGDVTVDGFVFSGAAAADGTAAGLLHTRGALVVRNSLFVGNQTGLSSVGDAAATVRISASEFARNGFGDGFTHNVSVGAIKSLTIADSYIHDAAGGAEVRSRARATTITGTRILDNAGRGTVSLDLPNVGAVLVQDSVIEKGAGAGAAVIRVGGDTIHAGSSVRVSGSTIVSDRAGALLVQNATTVGPVLSGNTVYGLQGLGNGPMSQSGTVVAAVRPAVLQTALVTETAALPVELGRAGAVVASGVVRSVGVGQAYSSVGGALMVAQDGDTIRVAAGTYAEEGSVITKRVVIEGVGGMARLVASGAPGNGKALFVVQADATFRNIDISGVAMPAGVAAAIRVEGADVTVVNSVLHDNQAGLVVEADVGGTVGVYDSEIARNGTPDGRGGNVDVGAIGTFTMRNSWVHDGVAAAEVRSLAANTVLEGDRISQMRGTGAAGVELPNGGRVSIAGGAIEKGADSQVVPLVRVGGGSVAAGSSVSVAGTVLISDLVGAPTSFVVAEGAPVAVSGVTFVGGAVGSSQVVGGSNVGAVVRAGGVAVSAASPWGASGAAAAGSAVVPMAVPAVNERGVLALRVSGDSFQGDARFTVAVDGVQVGGILVASASHGAGLTQPLVIAGGFAPGAHSVTVRFVNDLNGAGGQGRALYVDGATFNGEAFGGARVLESNGAVTLSTGASVRQTAVTVNLSEDAFRGDARAFIAIDGRVLGGAQTVTAAHGAGATQAMRFLVDLAPGPHVATVSYLNDLGARALYVDSIDVAGAHYPGAAAALPVNGSSAFAFTVAPPPAANTGLFLTAMAPELLSVAG